MKVDLIASEFWYRDHMLPIFECLPTRLQGHVFPLAPTPRKPLFDHVAMVAGWQDVVTLKGRAKMIYVEHGCGQAYLGDEKMATLPGYSGGAERHPRDVIGYICPSETVAARWSAPAVAVGCPKMSAYGGEQNGKLRIGPLAACLAFHWDCRLGPEMRSAFDHYRPRLAVIADSMRDQGFIPYAHSHPRWNGFLDALFVACGFEVLATDRDVFDKADMLIMDNSSLMYEFASLRRPVIALNAPWYRRDVEHGLRFWSHVPGVQVDSPEQLLELDLLSHLTKDPARALRNAAVAEAYASTDGGAAQRAAAWITQLLDSR
jgi:hypothetical protein